MIFVWPTTALAALLLVSTVAQSASPLKPEWLPARTYSETFSLIARLADGDTVIVEIAISNIGVGKNNGACRLIYLPRGGDAWSREIIVGEKDWRYQTSPERLQVGACFMENGSTVQLSAPLGDRSVHFIWSGPVARTRPPHSEVRVGKEDIFEFAVITPWAPAQAFVDKGAGSLDESAATVHVDHFRVTATPKALAKYWVRFRALEPAQSRLVAARVLPGGDQAEGWQWASGQAEPVSVGSLTLIGDVQQGKWRLESSDWHLSTEALQQRYAPLERIGVFRYLVKPFLGNPVTWRFRAILREPGKPPVHGLMELTTMVD